MVAAIKVFKGSNCTLLELKLVEVQNPRVGSAGSNCTLLELKRISIYCQLPGALGSNCTLLELKHIVVTHIKTGTIVLIVPYWN